MWDYSGRFGVARKRDGVVPEALREQNGSYAAELAAGSGVETSSCPARSHRQSAIRSLAWPSHSGGIVPRRKSPLSTARISVRSRSISLPTMTFVPVVVVIGRSVFSRSVRQGTPTVPEGRPVPMASTTGAIPGQAAAGWPARG